MHKKNIGQITQDLERWFNGSSDASARVFENSYIRLVTIAKSHRYKVGDITITPNEIVHEAYVRLITATENSKPHDSLSFYRLAAHVFRLTCIDYLRAKLASKRKLQDTITQLPNKTDDNKELLNLVILLEEFEEEYERPSMAFQLNKIIGFSLNETAQIMETSKATLSRDIKFARHWLANKL